MWCRSWRYENEGENPALTAAGYRNNTELGSGETATATELYVIDTDLDVLATQMPANMGTLSTDGPLGLDASEVNGFDTLTANPDIVEFDEDGDEVERTEVTGAAAGATLVGADIRSSTGQLYALGDDGTLYTVESDGSSASAGTIGEGRILEFGVGFDFNPSGPNALRIVLNDGVNTNLRVTFNPDGTVNQTIEDGPLAYEAGDENDGEDPGVTAAGYVNNSEFGSGETATATELYDLDTLLDVLTTQTPANDGTLQTVGDLGIDANDGANAFDILSEENGGEGDEAFAVLSTDTSAPAFYEIDLESGDAEFLETEDAPDADTIGLFITGDDDGF